MKLAQYTKLGNTLLRAQDSQQQVEWPDGSHGGVAAGLTKWHKHTLDISTRCQRAEITLKRLESGR